MNLENLFESEIEKIKAEMLAMPWEDKEFYRLFLSQTFYFVQHSTRLLALAGALAPLEDTHLHRRFTAHISEEKAHEQIALNDLTHLSNSSLSDIFIETRNLFEVQYFKITHQHPAALFGYILALEGIASRICPAIVSRIYDAHGVAAAKFLKLHVEEDPDHVDKALNEITKLPLQQYLLVEENLRQSISNYLQMIKAVHVRSQTTALFFNSTERKTNTESKAKPTQLQ